MIFVDTGAWYAAAVGETDADQSCRDQLEANADDLATSDAVLAELWMLLAARGFGHLAQATVADIVASATLLTPGPVDRRSALETLADWRDQPFSYCDALSFALMEREGIDQALSLDQHFAEFRFGVGRKQRFRVIPD